MKIRVYYEDTDCGGVVYYANYLKYMERSRTELLRENGLDFSRLHEQGILFVVVEAHVSYRSPARYNDLLQVDSRVVECSGVTLRIETDMSRHQDTEVARGWVKLACTSVDGKPMRIPPAVREAIAP